MTTSAPLDFEQQAEAAAIPPWQSRIATVTPDWFATPPPPRRWLLRDARTAARCGVLPAGKVGLVAAEGGAGKTTLAIDLACAVAAGRNWLDAFEVASPGRVLVLLGEEDEEEARRRVYRAGQHAPVPPGLIEVMYLAGMVCPVVEEQADSIFLAWLREHLRTHGPYALVIIDPLSRFAGADAEKDNAAATRTVAAMESLVEPSGGATILAFHHTSQVSRGAAARVDATSVRGVSALVDGCRWVATLKVDRAPADSIAPHEITLAMVKSNYSKFAAPVALTYDDEGGLVPLDDDGQARAQEARTHDDPKTRKREQAKAAKATRADEISNTALTVLRASPGLPTKALRDRVMATANCGTTSADTAIAGLVGSGSIRTTVSGKSRLHHVAQDDANDTYHSLLDMV